MRKIKVVVLLVRQLQHGFTKNAKVSPNLTVTHIGLRSSSSNISTDCSIVAKCYNFLFLAAYIIGVNRPAIVREISHFGLVPAFLRERPVFLAFFSRNNKNAWKWQ